MDGVVAIAVAISDGNHFHVVNRDAAPIIAAKSHEFDPVRAVAGSPGKCDVILLHVSIYRIKYFCSLNIDNFSVPEDFERIVIGQTVACAERQVVKLAVVHTCHILSQRDVAGGLFKICPIIAISRCNTASAVAMNVHLIERVARGPAIDSACAKISVCCWRKPGQILERAVLDHIDGLGVAIAKQDVIAVVSVDDIVATACNDGIVSTASAEGVVPVRAKNNVVVSASVDGYARLITCIAAAARATARAAIGFAVCAAVARLAAAGTTVSVAVVRVVIVSAIARYSARPTPGCRAGSAGA